MKNILKKAGFFAAAMMLMVFAVRSVFAGTTGASVPTEVVIVSDVSITGNSTQLHFGTWIAPSAGNAEISLDLVDVSTSVGANPIYKPTSGGTPAQTAHFTISGNAGQVVTVTIPVLALSAGTIAYDLSAIAGELAVHTFISNIADTAGIPDSAGNIIDETAPGVFDVTLGSAAEIDILLGASLNVQTGVIPGTYTQGAAVDGAGYDTSYLYVQVDWN